MLCRKSQTPAFQLAVNTITLKNPVLRKLAKKVKYEMKYGTPEIKHGTNKVHIWNVEDAKNALLELVSAVSSIQDNAITYHGKKKLGDMHVYSDGRPLQYISA
jgi:6-phosphogluconolactonase (cycloisomerase 2 family)